MYNVQNMLSTLYKMCACWTRCTYSHCFFMVSGLAVGVATCLVLTLLQAATPTLTVLELSGGVLLDR